MINMAIDPDTIREVRRNMQLGSREVRMKLGRIHLNVAQIPSKDARSHAPVFTGRLKASIKAVGDVTGAGVKARGYNLVQRGIAGRRRVRPRPFIEVGVRKTRPQWMERLKREYSKALNRHIDVTVEGG